MSKNALEIIKEGQKEWAKDAKVEINNKNYVKELTKNIFKESLSIEIIESFKHGSGNELKSKMRALHSSSALCVNFFQYLIEKQEILCKYLKSQTSNNYDIKFEDQYPTLEKNFKANLDISIIPNNSQSYKSYFIESKFTEPYTHGAGDNEFNLLKTSYFNKQPNIIGEVASCFNDLNKIKEFVFSDKWCVSSYTSNGKTLYGRKCNFKYLDAAQLIKHVFALTNSENKVTQKGDKSKFELIYIYFDSPIEEANTKHKKEIEELAEIFKLDKINFRAISYNNVIEKLYKDINSFDEETQEYINYLYTRYIKPYEK